MERQNQTQFDVFEKIFDKVLAKLEGDPTKSFEAKHVASQVALKLLEFDFQIQMLILQYRGQGIDLTGKAGDIAVARGPLPREMR